MKCIYARPDIDIGADMPTRFTDALIEFSGQSGWDCPARPSGGSLSVHGVCCEQMHGAERLMDAAVGRFEPRL